jgi:UDP-glucose 4-epimerase
MVTGGLGFIGSCLVHQLVQAGADVLVVDALNPDYGGNLFNLHGIEQHVRINISDVRDATSFDVLVRDREIIFNLAGQVSHIDSMRDPHTDLEINCRAQLSMLEACRKHNPRVRVVYAGTRQVYGRPDRLPVDESHLVRPADINGVNKAAGEYYHLLYNNVFGIRACSLRLTNVYGPRQLIRHNRQGFIGWFIRLAIEGREIQVFGDGSQLRDFVYVEDAADAFLRAGASEATDGEVFNVGGDEPISHRDLVALLIDAAGSGSYRFVDWPPDKKRIDIGSFYSDSTKFRKATGWHPRTALRDGLEQTIAFFRQHMEHYVDEVAAPVQETRS